MDPVLCIPPEQESAPSKPSSLPQPLLVTGDAYFSVDVETDGPIPGPFSLLSFALVYAGSFDGNQFHRPANYSHTFYRELQPISDSWQADALHVNGLDRDRLIREGANPATAMTEAAHWVTNLVPHAAPVLVAYPLGFDWAWLYWYFVRFSTIGSPFLHSRAFDIKTAVAVKSGLPISKAGRSRIPAALHPTHPHTHHALDDAIAQAEIFANVFSWRNHP